MVGTIRSGGASEEGKICRPFPWGRHPVLFSILDGGTPENWFLGRFNISGHRTFSLCQTAKERIDMTDRVTSRCGVYFVAFPPQDCLTTNLVRRHDRTRSLGNSGGVKNENEGEPVKSLENLCGSY
uniref:Uncharacterized protein n=1 Tax=Trieres chinensis TaxID=1514140 RepID=A0A7S2EXR5_TRICV